jgi:hypothetical protein
MPFYNNSKINIVFFVQFASWARESAISSRGRASGLLLF